MKKRKLYTFICSLTLTICLINTYQATAQNANQTTAPVKQKWHLFLEPYIMFPNMHGTVGLSTFPDATVDEDPGDIFENIQIAAMLYTEASKGPWAISSDMTYMKLSSDIAGNRIVTSGNVTEKQLGWELAVLYKLQPWLEMGLAGQLNSISSELELSAMILGTPTSLDKDVTKTWVDPSIIARVKLPLSPKLSVQFRGNIGGFDIASEFYWQVQAYATYRFSKMFQTSVGYRAVGVDYESGSGSDRFKYDMTTFGPVLRAGFNF